MGIFADDLNALMDELMIEKANILGFSMGGNIALIFALSYPDMVSKLIIAASHAVMSHQIRLYVDVELDIYEKGISTKQMFELICLGFFKYIFG